jgi:hypothetical protein
MPNLGTSNRTALRYVPEVTFGTTPATPAFKDIRYTGESLNYSIKNVVSNEIRSDRNTTDLVRVSADAAGDVQFEMSFLSFDAFIEAALCNSFSAPVSNLSSIKNGTALKSFSLQKHFQDLDTPVFQTFNGCRVGGLTLDFKTGQILTGSFSFMGLGATTGTAQIAGATTTASPGVSENVMNAVTDLIEIKENGVASTMVIRALSLNLNNNLRAQDAIGSLPHVGVALGKLEITGNIEAYFADLTAYNRFINGTAFALSFKVNDSTGDYYRFTLPAVKYESGQVVAGGLDQDLVFQGTWRAIYDPTSACMIQIDKFDNP